MIADIETRVPATGAEQQSTHDTAGQAKGTLSDHDQKRVQAARDWAAFQAKKAEAERVKSVKSVISADPWPDPPGEAAYTGLAGDFVRLADQFTEADPVAVLGQFLAAFGCAAGSGPHAMVGPTRHAARIFLAIVGQSAKSRKGESLSPVLVVLRAADPEFSTNRVQSGIASGEGLIAAVRDPRYDSDPGVTDKRLLVPEPELARVLQTMRREGNTTSAITRDAWDRGNLQIINKNTPIKATDAHIVIIGHITEEELRRELTATDAANGFANRFIFLAVRRSKYLPEPEIFEGPEVNAIVMRVRNCLDHARGVGCMKRDEEARELWAQEYRNLSEGQDGLVGSILARAEAQVLRLSLLYALLDMSGVVKASHLQSALELWRYSERSAQHIFGKSTGDRVADTIYAGLKKAGPNDRTYIHKTILAGHVDKGRIDIALDLLRSKELATTREVKTDGRAREVWEAL